MAHHSVAPMFTKRLSHIREAVESVSERHRGIKVLDVGPGRTPIKGADYIDYRSWPYGVTFQHDLRIFPWPIDDNTYDLVFSSHCFEHLERRDIYRALEEIHRISRDGVVCIIIVPHYSGPVAWQTLGHVRPFGIWSLNDYTGTEATTRFLAEAVRLRWRPNRQNKLLRAADRVITRLANLNPHVCEQLWCNYVNGFEDVVYILRVLK